MYRMTSESARRRRVVHQIEMSILTIKYGIPVLCVSSFINFILDCCGVGMIY